MFGLGWQELLVILAIVLVLFGAKRLPQIGRSFGESIKEFRRAGNALLDDPEEDDRDSD